VQQDLRKFESKACNRPSTVGPARRARVSARQLEEAARRPQWARADLSEPDRRLRRRAASARAGAQAAQTVTVTPSPSYSESAGESGNLMPASESGWVALSPWPWLAVSAAAARPGRCHWHGVSLMWCHCDCLHDHGVDGPLGSPGPPRGEVNGVIMMMPGITSPSRVPARPDSGGAHWQAPGLRQAQPRPEPASEWLGLRVSLRGWCQWLRLG